MSIQHADNEWRFDPIDEAWSVVARNRRVLTPKQMAPTPGADRVTHGRRCAFCAGEPENVIQRRSLGSLEVAAVASPTPLLFTEHGPAPDHAFDISGALGAHELVVPLGRPFCGAPPSAWGDEACAAVFLHFAERHADLGRDLRLRSIGMAALPPAVTRVPHGHAVLLASPHPPRLAQPAEHCPITLDLERARRDGRMVLDEEGLVAWVPFAPRASVHVRVSARLSRLPPEAEEVMRYGRLVSRVLRGVDAAVGTSCASFSLTKLALRPSMSKAAPLLADIEAPIDADRALSTALGVRICTLPPEDLARVLSGVIPPADESDERSLQPDPASVGKDEGEMGGEADDARAARASRSTGDDA